MAENIIDGPDSIFSEDLEPSRGQYHSIAVAALELLGVPAPATRFDASVALVRLRLALKAGKKDVPEVPPV